MNRLICHKLMLNHADDFPAYTVIAGKTKI